VRRHLRGADLSIGDAERVRDPLLREWCVPGRS
jgi:hypothetical protein